MYREAQLYCAALDRKKIKHDDIVTLDSGKFDVETRWNLEDTSIAVRCIFDKDGHTVAVRAYRFSKANDNNYAKILFACNKLNNRFRWVKFVIDDDNDVNIETDAIVDEHSVGEVLTTLVNQMCSIADDAYPILMKAAFSD